jgi:hypothetical protein
LASELRIVDSLLAEAEYKSDQALVEAHFLEQALQHVHQLKDPRKEATALRRRIEEAYRRAEPQFKSFSFEVKITEEQVQQLIDHYFTDDAQDTLHRLGASQFLLPDYESAEDIAKRLAKEHPLQHIFARSTIQSGRRVAQQKGGIEVNEDHIVSQMGENLKILGIYQTILFRELKSRGIGAKEVADFLSGSATFQYDNFPAIAEGLKDFEQGSYYSALCVLVPQVEEALRQVVAKLGQPTMQVVNGLQQAIKIGEILSILRPGLGENVYWYLALLTFDKRGMALRDDLAHGLLKHGSMNETQVYLVVHALLLLSCFKIQ